MTVDLPAPPGLARFARHAVVLLLVAGIVLSHFLRDGHDDQRLLELFLFALIGLVVIASGRLATLALPLPRPLFWLLFVFFACGLASSLLAFSPRYALLEVGQFLLLLMIAVAAARDMARDYDVALQRVLWLLAAGVALYLVQVLVAWCAAVLTQAPLDLNSMAPAFSNYRLLNHAQTITLPLLLLLCCESGSARRWPILVLTACWFGLLIALSGRGSLVAIAAGAVVALVLRRRHALAYCRTVALLAAAGAAVYAVSCVAVPRALGLAPFGEFSQIVARTMTSPASRRGELWQNCLDFMSAHPLLGIGPMQFAHEAARAELAAHPHMWLLQIGAEWGIPAMLALCLILALAGWALLRSAGRLAAGDATGQTRLTAWIVIGTAILVDGLVSGNIVMPVSQLCIALYLACACGFVWSLNPPASTQTTPAARLAVGSLLMLAALGVIVAILPDLPRTGENYHQFPNPRLWVNGHF